MQAFIGNQYTCLKIQPKQLEKIIHIIGKGHTSASDFLDLLISIVKVERLDMPLKRNQALVMKYIMQTYAQVASVFDKPKAERYVIVSVSFSTKQVVFY